MSVFVDIMSAIFGRSASAAPASSAAPSTSTPPPASAAPSAAPAAKPAAAANVDVAAVLDGLAKQNKQRRTSIVDLMKLLDLDSSSAARQHLADELHYQGDKRDSAKMNVWLHRQVMIKLAQNGNKVPDELKH